MESLLVARPGHLYGNGVLGRAAIKTNGNKSSSEEVTNKLQFPLGMRRYQNLLNYSILLIFSATFKALYVAVPCPKAHVLNCPFTSLHDSSAC